jgi:hypothetical protein
MDTLIRSNIFASADGYAPPLLRSCPQNHWGKMPMLPSLNFCGGGNRTPTFAFIRVLRGSILCALCGEFCLLTSAATFGAHLDTVDVSGSRSDGFVRDASASRGSGVPAAIGSYSRGGDAAPTSFGQRKSASKSPVFWNHLQCQDAPLHSCSAVKFFLSIHSLATMLSSHE